MFKIIRKIRPANLIGSKLNEIESWIDEQFYLNIPIQENDIETIENKFEVKDKVELDKFGKEMRKNCPDSLGKSLFYIREHTDYPRGNHLGRYCLYHVWPLFFEKFPLGQIWIIELPKSWTQEVWKGQRELAIKYGYDKSNPTGFSAQEMTGLQIDNFHLHSLNILSYGIYPLILSNFISIGLKSNLTLLYIPDRAFEYSQMMEADTLYTNILWDFHHLFDDQWTFDSSRGAKSSTSGIILNPINLLDYFQWFIDKIDNRMKDIISIEDHLLREKLVMTVNRAIYDALLSVTTELPYISKIFFFNFLDKFANIMHLLGMEDNDTKAWLKLVDKNFLCDTVLKTVQNIPNPAGEYLSHIVTFAVKEMEYGELLPDNLRDIRNTHHGYNIKSQSIDRLMEKDGEINNDIPLIVIPLLLYIFSIPWNNIENE